MVVDRMLSFAGKNDKKPNLVTVATKAFVLIHLRNLPWVKNLPTLRDYRYSIDEATEYAARRTEHHIAAYSRVFMVAGL